MAYGLASFHEPTPDDEHVFVHIEQPIREPRPQLVIEPLLQSLS
jgi:hypothetical protein